MLHVTCPRPCCLADLGRVGFHRLGPRKGSLQGFCAQRPQQITSALPSYQHVLKEELVRNLSELARSISKRGVPAQKAKGELLVKKLLPKDSSVEDVHLPAYQATDAVYALSVLGSSEHFEREMELLLQVAARDVEQYIPEGITRLLYGAARSQHHSPALNTLATSKRLLDGLPAMRPLRVGQLLWALAVLDIKPPAILDRLQATMAAIAEDAPGSQQLHFCWTLAVLGQAGSEAFQIPWMALMQKQQEEIGTSLTHTTEYCQVVEELQITGQRCKMSAEHLALYERYLKLRRERLAEGEGVVSALHKDVMTALELSSTEYEEEAIIGIYSVDIALPAYKVVIEVDGPAHFTRTRPRRPLGQTLMKQRHLEGAGWVVVSVSSDDWYAQESWQQKMCMLRDLFYSIEKRQLEAGA